MTFKDEEVGLMSRALTIGAKMECLEVEESGLLLLSFSEISKLSIEPPLAEGFNLEGFTSAYPTKTKSSFVDDDLTFEF